MTTSLRSFGRHTVLLVGVVLSGVSVVADGILPVTLNLREQESNRFLAQWRVPKQLPPRAIPSPVLPESCRSAGERTVTERSAAWIVRQAYVCPEGLTGQSIGIDYPFLNATVSTLLQVELLSGDRYAHMLAPGEPRWRVPRETAHDARAWYRAARQAVVAGAEHFAGNGVHVAFVLVLVALGGLAASFRLVSAFSAGQLVAVVVSSATGMWLAPPLAEVGLAAAVALLAREALRPPEERRQLVLLAASAGLVHGLGLARLVLPPVDHDGSTLVFYGLVVLGMDASLLVAALAGSSLRRILPERLSRRAVATAAVYGIGVIAIALALGFPAADATTASAESTSGIRMPDLPIPEGAAGTPGSRRVATPFPDAPLQSFVTIAPFEVRHEVLVRPRDLAGRIGLEPTGEVAIEAQDGVKRRIRDLVARRTEVVIDGRELEPAERRVDFLGLDSRGALPRLSPIPEPIDTAWIGVTTVYVTDRTPTEVALTWSGFDSEPTVPATITDPESSVSVELNRREPALVWTNELSEDPTPVVSAIAVQPPVLWMPVVSMVPLALAVVFGAVSLRGRRRGLSAVIARVGLACACLLAPVGNVAIPLPSSAGSTPDPARAKRILARVLPNVYRAFEYPTESAVYDRLALSVTGDTLTEIYLEHRRAVRMEERGGAKARVEAVEVVEVDSVDPGTPEGFVARTAWTVGGTVTHFGHRHFRQNRYDARVTVVPVDGYWKIRSLEVFDEKRLR
jgi:hypothetical protein